MVISSQPLILPVKVYSSNASDTSVVGKFQTMGVNFCILLSGLCVPLGVLSVNDTP